MTTDLTTRGSEMNTELKQVETVTLLGKEFVIYGTVEEPLFLARDVANWIGHSNITAMISSVDDDEKSVLEPTKDCLVGGKLQSNTPYTFLTENGVYEVLMLSRKSIAKSFKKEVKKLLHELRLSRKPQMPTNLADALEAYAKEIRAKEEAQRHLIESNKRTEEAEKETERIYQVNKNFHANLYTATEIGKKLGISANQVGRIANEKGLKQDPIYGKLGKIQLNNGQWVNQFYYNDDALTVIEAVIG